MNPQQLLIGLDNLSKAVKPTDVVFQVPLTPSRISNLEILAKMNDRFQVTAQDVRDFVDEIHRLQKLRL